ncbi:uncharacterized protein [Elaeis guineensis]|uniref:uncharacterized protein n=1 Tax=Elaeis guineensis var. tenera TaxID=51953 RepID=UPI003C6D759E
MRFLRPRDLKLCFRGNNGRSPVHLCASEDRVDVFFELFRRCPDALDAVDGGGRNALHIAIECQKELVAHLLMMTQGIDLLLNQRDWQGKTSLRVAVEKHNPDKLQQLLRIKRVDTCVTDSRGLTAPQSFYMDEQPALDSAWYESHSVLSDACAEDDACKQNFVKKNIWRMEFQLLQKVLGTYSHIYLSFVAVLMAVVTSVAAFMIPDGYLNEDGPEEDLAVFSRKPAVKIFMIFDTISMCCSLLATYIYLTTAIKPGIGRSLYITFGEILVSLTFLGMIIAFAIGIHMQLWHQLACGLECSYIFVAVKDS